MKKHLLIVVLMLITYSAFSQKKLHLGVKAGVNYSSLSNTSFDYKPGLYVGLFLQVQVSDFYALQPELYYSNQGAKTNFLGAEDVNIHYVSIAFANKFFIMNDQRFHLLAGIGLDLDWDDNLINLANSGFETNNIFAVDMTVFGGLGYQFDMGLTIEARYKRGLIGVFTDELFEENNHFNSVFQFGLAYKFDLKK
ncbi:MAG: porin family protein [Flavobacteriaceae bacterium]